MEPELAARVAAARGAERDVAAEIYQLRDAVSTRVVDLEQAVEELRATLCGLAMRASPVERLRRLREARRLEQLERVTAQMLEGDPRAKTESIGWKGWTSGGNGG